MPSSSNIPWIIFPISNPRTRLRLFCFPYAGGGASIYRSWFNDLPAEVEVCPIQLPGRESRFLEPAFTRLRPLVLALAKKLITEATLPFAFFGHSMGALIAFELARKLRKIGAPTPVHLYVAGHRAPQLPETRSPTYDLPEQAFIAEIARLNGTPRSILENVELMELMLPALRADCAVTQTYIYRSAPPLSCPITVFGGSQDPEVTEEELVGWQEQTSARFTSRMVPGDHFFLLNERALFLQYLALDLRQDINSLAGNGI